ncbi:MAG: phage major capsid protein, partial [Myxococcales bacterium]
FRKQLSSGEAHYTGEADVIEPSQPGGGEETMKERELTSLSVINNTLIKNASVSAEEFVRDDMLAVKARREQLALLRGDGANNTPRGIFHRVAAANRITAVQAGAEATLAEIRKDVSRIMTLLKNANAPMIRPVWMTNPTVEEFLYTVLNELGLPVYEAMLDQGKWARGFPFETTTQLPADLGGGGNESELALVDFSEVILGVGPMYLDVFPNGTYEEGGKVKSGISRNQTVIRLIDYHDIFMRHEESGVVCNVKYGA